MAAAGVACFSESAFQRAQGLPVCKFLPMEEHVYIAFGKLICHDAFVMGELLSDKGWYRLLWNRMPQKKTTTQAL